MKNLAISEEYAEQSLREAEERMAQEIRAPYAFISDVSGEIFIF